MTVDPVDVRRLLAHVHSLQVWSLACTVTILLLFVALWALILFRVFETS